MVFLRGHQSTRRALRSRHVGKMDVVLANGEESILHGLPRAMWANARKHLQRIFHAKPDLQLLIDAEIVYIWVGKDKMDEVQHVSVTFAALHYLRPWRSTLLLVEFASSEDKDRLLRMCFGEGSQHSRSFSAMPQEADFITFTVHPFDTSPQLLHAIRSLPGT